MPELNPIPATRIVARPEALDAAKWPAETLVLRFAPDEALIMSAVAVQDPLGNHPFGTNRDSTPSQPPPARGRGQNFSPGGGDRGEGSSAKIEGVDSITEAIILDDPHAIVIAESGYAGLWLAADKALDFLERACEWALPADRPAFAQGAVAGIPTKLWLEEQQVLFILPAPYAADFEERLHE